MAGTRGLGRFRGEQLNDGILRNQHFNETHRIDEKYIQVDWSSHREALTDTKIEVWSQLNDITVAGVSSVVVSALDGKNEAVDLASEGVVTGKPVEVRLTGTADTSEKDADADRVYGRLSKSGVAYTLSFYSVVDGVETTYTFAADAPNVDARYVLRTNLAVVPVDAILNGGSGFVEGATDALAYMNILQLAQDIYGPSASLDKDGNANLDFSLVEQLTQLRGSLEDAVEQLLSTLSSAEGAALVGVTTDVHYAASTVQSVLSELAERIAHLETKGQEEVYEALGGESDYAFKNGPAAPGTVLVAINGQLQAPSINFTYTRDTGNNTITGITFAPDTLKVTNGIPDVLLIKYEKVFTSNLTQ